MGENKTLIPGKRVFALATWFASTSPSLYSISVSPQYFK